MFKMDAYGKLSTNFGRVTLPGIQCSKDPPKNGYYTSAYRDSTNNNENIIVDKHLHITISDESFIKGDDSLSNKGSSDDSNYDLPPTNDSSKTSVQQMQL